MQIESESNTSPDLDDASHVGASHSYCYRQYNTQRFLFVTPQGKLGMFSDRSELIEGGRSTAQVGIVGGGQNVPRVWRRSLINTLQRTACNHTNLINLILHVVLES